MNVPPVKREIQLERLFKLTVEGWLPHLNAFEIKTFITKAKKLLIHQYSVETMDNKGKLHSFDNQPAIVYAGTARSWWKHGRCFKNSEGTI